MGAGRTVHRVWKLGSWISILGIVRHVLRLQPDVVYINGHLRGWGSGALVSMIGAALPLLLRLSGQRVMTTLHVVPDNAGLDQLGIKVGLAARIGIWLALWLYLRSHLVTVTLRSMQERLQDSFGGANVVHVEHGTYGALVDTVPNPGPRVLAFGFWGSSKDPALVADAVEGLRSLGVNAELVLAGGAHPYYPEVYQQLVERYRERCYVTFTGYVPEDQLPKLFTSAAVVVLPYRTNTGASGVLNLCRSYGRPVVISADGALLEQVEQEGGEALTFVDQAQLTQVLHQILSDDELRARMGAANLSVTEVLTMQTQAERLVALCSAIVSGEGGEMDVSPARAGTS